MRVLVCGSRAFEDYELLQKTLHEFVVYDERPFPYLPEDFVLIQGGAKGADSLADQWASVYGVSSICYKADWEKYGKAAGPIRNKQMLDEGKPDLVIAFLSKVAHEEMLYGFSNNQHSRGTKNMIEQAIKAGIPVKVVDIG